MVVERKVLTELISQMEQAVTRAESSTDSETKEKHQITAEKCMKAYKMHHTEFKLSETDQQNAIWLQELDSEKYIPLKERLAKLKPKTNADLLSAALVREQKTSVDLYEIRRVVVNTEELGREVIIAIDEQGEQQRRIRDKTNSIQGSLSLANRRLTIFMRRLVTDRCFLCFAGLILFTIIGIVAYTVAVPNQTIFKIPDVAKPPSPSDVQHTISSSGE